MADLSVEDYPIPDFVKFMSPSKSLIDDVLEKCDPDRATVVEAEKCEGKVTNVTYRYDKLTGMCTAVIRVK